MLKCAHISEINIKYSLYWGNRFAKNNALDRIAYKMWLLGEI